jgi:hypothetical protein
VARLVWLDVAHVGADGAELEAPRRLRPAPMGRG